MSPKLRHSLGLDRPDFSKRLRTLLITGGAIVSAVLVVTAPVVSGAKAVDTRYVHQSGYATDRKFDSLTHEQEVRELKREMASVDTGVKCLRRVLPETVCRK